MKALILAAGLGSRLASITSGKTKCLLELHGKSILRHQLDLLSACGVDDITVITGFEAEQVRSHVKGTAACAYYPGFASSNNLLTLHYCRELLTGEVLLLFADVLITPNALKATICNTSDFVLLVDSSKCVAGTMRVRLSGSTVTDIGPHLHVSEDHGNFVGIARFSARGSELLAGELDEFAGTRDCSNAYYTEALRSLTEKGHRVESVNLDGSPWLEVDTEEDYLAARTQTFYLSDSFKLVTDVGSQGAL